MSTRAFGRPAGLVVLVAMVGIVLVGAWLRFYEIANVPPGLHFDLAFNAFDIARLYLGDWRIFFPANTGREPLYIYLQALFTLAFGLNRYALQLTSAFVGVATIPLMYRFTKRLMGSSLIGVLAALFTAISFWHLFYSRLGLRAILMVPLTICTFWMLWEGITSLRQRYFALAGVFLALAVYTYLSARLLPIAIVLILGYAILTDRQNARHYLRGGLVIGVVSLVLTLPLWYYFWMYPDQFIDHSIQISVFNPEISGGDVTGTFLLNALNLFGMFVVRGDDAIIRNLPGRPVFDPLVGIFFLVGTAVWLYTCVAPKSTRPERMRAVVLLVWVVVILPASLLSMDAPSFIRLIPVLPVVMILPAWGAAAIWHRLHGQMRYVGAFGLMLIVAFSGWRAYSDYFVTFRQDPALYQAFDQENVEIADWINAHAKSNQIYLAPLLYQQGTIAFLTRALLFKSFDSRDTLVLPPSDGDLPALYAYPLEQEKRIETVQKRLPGGTREDLLNPMGNPILLVYRVPNAQVPRGTAALENISLSNIPGPAQELDAVWESTIRLVGMRVESAGLGQRQLHVTLYLESLVPINQDLTFSIKVRDSDGQVLGQEDKMPGSNSYPTHWWTPGEVIIERFYPEFDDCPPTGEYTITAELYDPEGGRVLDVDGLNGNVLTLGSVQGVDCAWDAQANNGNE